MPQKVRAIPRRVDFLTDLDDFRVVMLGTLGKSTRYIVRTTDMTPCQVTYRLKQAQVKRADYRNGTSAYDRLIMRSVDYDLTLALRRALKHQFGGKRKK